MKETIMLPIKDLKPYPGNPRINKDAVDKVAASLREFGFRQPIVVDKDYVIIVGHTRLKAAKKLKLKEVPVLVADDMTEEQAKAYRLADNKTAEFAQWDDDLLSEELDAISDIDMEQFGFEINLDDIDEEELEAEEDEVPENPETRCKPGDVWQLGTHRLICGDSTDALVIDKLMDGAQADMVFTDPPYGVSANGGRGDTKKKLGMQEIINDDLREDDLYSFLASAFALFPVKDNGSMYICYPWATQEEFTRAIKDNGYTIQNCIIWRKNVFGLNGFKGYRPQYEMIYFCSPSDDYEWYGDLAQSNVWDFNRSTEHVGNHPTPKPVELVANAIKNSSKRGEIVFDAFGGSGSTLIACEQLKRVCYMCELDPTYCDVIISRWEQFTGEEAILLQEGESDG